MRIRLHPGEQRTMTSTSPDLSRREPWPQRVGPTLLAAGLYAAFLFYLHHLEGPPGGWLEPIDHQAANLLSNILARASVALISAVFASLFLAVPLTASMYTPELIGLFVRSWANRLVLALFVVSSGVAVWTGRLVTADNVPRITLTISLGLVLLSIIVLLPYVFFVFRFLDPDTIIDRVAETVIQAMQPSSRGDIRERQHELSRRIHQLGNIILRALDRSDREVALAAVAALARCSAAYFKVEASHPEAWFTVDTSQFPGLSREAVALLNREHTWVEMELLRQLWRGYEAALAKVPAVLSAISRIDRHLALEAASRDDTAALHLAIRFFNNFLREAIKRRDLRAVFDVLYQYRLLAIELWETRPALVVRIARYLDYYGRMAATLGMGFAQELVAYDLGAVVAHAIVHEKPWADPLFKVFLQIRRPGTPSVAMGLSPGLFKARLILAATLMEGRRLDLASQIEKSLIGVPRDLVHQAREDLLGDVEECFWEVTDRQVNLDYLPPSRKGHVAVILEWVDKNAA
jgi:predicted membrane protein DUF2254